MYLPVEWPAADLIATRARRSPDRLALIDAEDGARWAYRELSEGPVDGMAAGLRAAGLQPGDRLGVALSPGIRMAHLVHATARAGGVLVPLPPTAPPSDLRRRCRVADIEAVACDADTESAVVEAYDGPVVSVDPSETAGVSQLPTEHDGGPTYRWGPDEPHWLIFTSGTTGDPKAVQLTLANLVASATASSLRLGVDTADRWLACLPMHHVGGLAPLVRSALYGTAAVVQPGFEVEPTRHVLEDHAVTAVSLVPTMVKRLLDVGWTAPESLRFVLLGGAAAPSELLDRCLDADIPVCPTYGATETASQVATARPDEVAAQPGTVGKPLRGVDLRILDEGNDRVPPGEPGRIVVSGPMVSPGYYDAEADEEDQLSQATFRPPDRGYLDTDGRLWVIGRADEAIISGGETVSPAAVRRVLETHPAVERAAVVGLPDEEWGEIVGALVVPTTSGDFRPEPVQALCREQLEPPAVPKVLVATTALPRTASDTVDRGAVRDRLVAARRGDGF